MSSAYKTLHKIKHDNALYVSRNDYAEFLDLVILYLKKDSFGTFRFRQPGAQYRARWMSSAVYTLKMLLQTKLDIDPKILKPLELFGYFVAVIYAPSCFRAPVATEAAVIDLECTRGYFLFAKMKNSEVYALLQSLHYEDMSCT